MISDRSELFMCPAVAVVGGVAHMLHSGGHWFIICVIVAAPLDHRGERQK